MPLRFDVNYNWERGKWHPFVGTGVGSYFLQYRRRDEPLGSSVTRFGLNAGGGIEFFLNRTVALKGEGRYHSVADFGRVDPSGGNRASRFALIRSNRPSRGERNEHFVSRTLCAATCS